MKERSKYEAVDNSDFFLHLTDTTAPTALPLWHRPVMMRAASAMLLAMGLIATNGDAVAQDDPNRSETIAYANRVWQEGDNFDNQEEQMEVDTSIADGTTLNQAKIDTGLGSAIAYAWREPKVDSPTAPPILRSYVSSAISGDSSQPLSFHPSRVSGARATHYLGGVIALEKRDLSGPTAEFVSFDWWLHSTLFAAAPIQPPGRDLPDTRSWQSATSGIIHSAGLSINGDPLPHFQASAGAGAYQSNNSKSTTWWPDPYIPQPYEYRELDRRKQLATGGRISIARGEFNFSFVFSLSGQAVCGRPKHVARIKGDATNSAYFSGFKFYDRNQNLLPPGAYSAIGEDGIDWSLPNVPQQVETIAVLNSGFEAPLLDDGKRTDNGGSNWITGVYVIENAPGNPRIWMPGSNALGNEAGIWNPDPSGGFADGAAFAGENNGWATTSSTADTGLSQVLAETLQADTDYLLSVQVGNPLVNGSDEPAPYRIELLAGGAVLNSVSGTSPATGNWQLQRLAFEAGPNAGHLGKSLEIRLVAERYDKDGEDGYQVDFDEVTLTATTIVFPDPRPFEIEEISMNDGIITLSWNSQPEKDYEIYQSADPTGFEFALFKTVVASEDENPDDGDIFTVSFPNPTITDEAPSGASELFLRVEALPAVP